MTTNEQIMLDFQPGSRHAFRELFRRCRRPIDAFFRRRLNRTTHLVTSRAARGAHTHAATLRVPAEHLDSLLGELKQLGRVEATAEAMGECDFIGPTKDGISQRT